MKRLVQLGALLIVLATFLVPLSEYCDRWDAPGISNDTEFAVFALIVTLCLVLLVSKLTSALAAPFGLTSVLHLQPSDPPRTASVGRAPELFVPPLSPPPLRI